MFSYAPTSPETTTVEGSPPCMLSIVAESVCVVLLAGIVAPFSSQTWKAPCILALRSVIAVATLILQCLQNRLYVTYNPVHVFLRGKCLWKSASPCSWQLKYVILNRCAFKPLLCYTSSWVNGDLVPGVVGYPFSLEIKNAAVGDYNTCKMLPSLVRAKTTDVGVSNNNIGNGGQLRNYYSSSCFTARKWQVV